MVTGKKNTWPGDRSSGSSLTFHHLKQTTSQIHSVIHSNIKYLYIRDFFSVACVALGRSFSCFRFNFLMYIKKRCIVPRLKKITDITIRVKCYIKEWVRYERWIICSWDAYQPALNHHTKKGLERQIFKFENPILRAFIHYTTLLPHLHWQPSKPALFNKLPGMMKMFYYPWPPLW